MAKQKQSIELDALRRFVKEHGTQTAAANLLGVSQGHLNDMLSGKRGIVKVLPKLGLERRVVVAVRPEVSK